ncbi:MAG: sensor histidine kinase, partial [Acidimicrobiia bacterium]|nr:sensor histidine kinase [Acidimicrobiia bacterium]
AVSRAVWPLRAQPERMLVVRMVLELVVTAGAAAATGGWSSPFAFSLVTAPIVAGLARGFLSALATCSASILLVGTADVLWHRTPTDEASQWVVELVLVALVSGYARRILGEREAARNQALDRVGQLADANALLFSLHQVAQTMPASLDLDEALDSTMNRLRDLFDYDAAALLTLDDTDGTWVVARRDGVRPPSRMDPASLPRPLVRALAVRSTISEPNLLARGGPGLAPRLVSGLYAVLVARGAIIGLVAIEHGTEDHFGDRDIELLQGLVEPVALAVDNARWFDRLRTVGAEEERSRIARELHDRIGQSLAYLAFELDRIMKASERGNDVRPSLERLREDVRSVVGEVRDTLYDLRTDVSEDRSFLATLELFLARVRERSGLDVTVRTDERRRLPVPQERELFRIAQEAIVNVERHATALHVTVSWRSDEHEATLEVADDGIGFPVGRAGRMDSYGLLGMRERVSSIGATLDVESAPGQGTRIRCSIPVQVSAGS